MSDQLNTSKLNNLNKYSHNSSPLNKSSLARSLHKSSRQSSQVNETLLRNWNTPNQNKIDKQLIMQDTNSLNSSIHSSTRDVKFTVVGLTLGIFRNVLHIFQSGLFIWCYNIHINEKVCTIVISLFVLISMLSQVTINGFWIEAQENTKENIFLLLFKSILMVLTIFITNTSLIPMEDMSFASSFSLVWMAILANIYLHESIRFSLVSNIPMLLIGAMLITRPQIIQGNENFTLEQPFQYSGYFWTFIVSILLALNTLVLRKLRHTPFYLSVIFSMIGLCMIQLIDTYQTVDKSEFILSQSQIQQLWWAGVVSTLFHCVNAITLQFMPANDSMIINQLNLPVLYFMHWILSTSQLFVSTQIGAVLILIANIVNTIF